jgi:hypothetical protein
MAILNLLLKGWYLSSLLLQIFIKNKT